MTTNTPTNYIKSRIANVQYNQPYRGATIVQCCIILDTGYVVTGESQFVARPDFEIAAAEKVAYAKAYDKLRTLFMFVILENHRGFNAKSRSITDYDIQNPAGAGLTQAEIDMLLTETVD